MNIDGQQHVGHRNKWYQNLEANMLHLLQSVGWVGQHDSGWMDGWMDDACIPSGNQTWQCKIPSQMGIWMGTSSINGGFSSHVWLHRAFYMWTISVLVVSQTIAEHCWTIAALHLMTTEETLRFGSFLYPDISRFFFTNFGSFPWFGCFQKWGYP